MKYTLEIYKPSIGATALLHHRQEFEFDDQYQASMVLVATRETLPPRFMAGMTFNKNGTVTNVRIPGARSMSPEAFIEATKTTLRQRGISGELGATYTRMILKDMDGGKTPEEAGRDIAMHIIRTT